MGRRSITPDKLSAAIKEELTLYHEEVNEGLREVTQKAVKELVKKTRATAPKDTGDFRKAIAGDFRGLKSGFSKISATWYVKAPLHRITHLLVNGHAKKNGGRVPGDPFLENALADVLPTFEKDVEEVLKNG